MKGCVKETIQGKTTRPYAYLNYIVFDTAYVLRDAGAIRVPVAAGFDPGMESDSHHQQLAFAQPIQPQQAGYIYVWACQPKL
ncbi:MAG TPA: hypothetical protein DCE81_05045, partial [Cytophagales bacterium]|nr:hypothetical protein [Cytophagales bacterium]